MSKSAESSYKEAYETAIDNFIKQLGHTACKSLMYQWATKNPKEEIRFRSNSNATTLFKAGECTFASDVENYRIGSFTDSGPLLNYILKKIIEDAFDENGVMLVENPIADKLHGSSVKHKKLTPKTFSIMNEMRKKGLSLHKTSSVGLNSKREQSASYVGLLTSSKLDGGVEQVPRVKIEQWVKSGLIHNAQYGYTKLKGHNFEVSVAEYKLSTAGLKSVVAHLEDKMWEGLVE